MNLDPKSVQKAVKIALALANPVLSDKDWAQLKERFKLEDNILASVKKLVDACEKDPDLKTVLSCLTFGV